MHDVADLADALWRAEHERAPIAPLTDARPGLTVDDAYAIQTHNVARRVAAGAVVRGRKVGLTSRPTQQLLGVDEPTSGCCSTTCSSTTAPSCRSTELLQPRVEAEMAFVLATDLAGPGVTTADALAAIGGVLPAIEVVDSRIADWRSRIADTVADNARAARVVLGAQRPVEGWTCACSACCSPATASDRQRRGRGRARPPGRAAWRGWPTRSAGSAGAAPRRRRAGGGLDPDGRRSVPATASPPSSRTWACVSVRFAGWCAMTDPQTMAEALLAAERDAHPDRAVQPAQPVPRREVGYTAQELVVAQARRAGEQVVGIKLGMTSKVKRDALGIREPVYGRITADMLCRPASRSRWPS